MEHSEEEKQNWYIPRLQILPHGGRFKIGPVSADTLYKFKYLYEDLFPERTTPDEAWEEKTAFEGHFESLKELMRFLRQRAAFVDDEEMPMLLKYDETIYGELLSSLETPAPKITQPQKMEPKRGKSGPQPG